MYWGSFDHGANLDFGIIHSLDSTQELVSLILVDIRLCGNNLLPSPGKRKCILGSFDKSGKLRTVAPALSRLLHQAIRLKLCCYSRGGFGNGGEPSIVSLSTPLVSRDLIAHWRFDEGKVWKFMIPLAFLLLGK